MIKYEFKHFNNTKNKNTKEKLQKRKEYLIKFRKKVQKQVKINDERYYKSLEYAKNRISD